MAHRFQLPRVLASCALLSLSLSTVGCQYMPCVAGYGNCEPPLEIDPETILGNGPCLPAYGTEVLSADMSATGTRILTITSAKPASLPEDASWPSDSLALTVIDLGGEGGQTTGRHLATTWAATDILVPYATVEDGEQPAEGVALEETMAEVQVDDAGNRFVVAVNRRDIPGGYAKLYGGTVPAEGVANYSPETKDLTLIGLNSTVGTEAVQSFALSPDGNKVAAAIGPQAELRVFDLSSPDNSVTIYDLNKDGKGVVVSHKLPEPCLGISCRRTPAVTSRGLMRFVWSPDNNRLAIVRTDSTEVPGQTSLWVMDVTSGKLELVRSFKDSSAPHAAWAEDGASLYVMNTPFSTSTEGGQAATDSAFGSTLVRRMSAAAGGKEQGTGASLPRQLGWKSDPVALSVLKGGESLVFVWEARLYRMDMPGGDLTKARLVYLLEDQRVPADLSVMSSVVAASAAQDTVMFLMNDFVGQRVGLRTSASADACPAAQGEATAPPVDPAAPEEQAEPTKVP